MPEIAAADVNDMFQRLTNQFGVDIQTRYTMEDPWGRLVRVGKFPLGQGQSLKEITSERVLSGSFEDAWSDVQLSDGSGIPTGASPTPEALAEFGTTVRSWNLQEQSYQTPPVNLDDLKTSYSIQTQVKNVVTQLTQLTKTVLSNRRRAEYARLVPKMSCGVDALGTTHSAIDATLPAPTSTLNHGLLKRLRVMLLRNGAGHEALGYENGAPTLGLITSAETSEDILLNNANIRQDLRYAKPSELLAPLGVERSYGGFFHIWDVELPRYDYIVDGENNPWVRRYPFVQTATTKGFKWEPNPYYDAAEYELSYIFHPNVYEECVDQVGPNIPDAPFEDYPHYYSGQFFWLNIKHRTENPLGKIGRWMSLFRNGSRPIAPYLGMAIMHKRCPYDNNYSGCSYGAEA